MELPTRLTLFLGAVTTGAVTTGAVTAVSGWCDFAVILVLKAAIFERT